MKNNLFFRDSVILLLNITDGICVSECIARSGISPSFVHKRLRDFERLSLLTLTKSNHYTILRLTKEGVELKKLFRKICRLNYTVFGELMRHV